MDIVERLRLGDGTSPDHRLLLEAADKIDRLREALQSVLDSQLLIGPTVLHDKVRGIVYAALQQKESE